MFFLEVLGRLCSKYHPPKTFEHFILAFFNIPSHFCHIVMFLFFSAFAWTFFVPNILPFQLAESQKLVWPLSIHNGVLLSLSRLLLSCPADLMLPQTALSIPACLASSNPRISEGRGLGENPLVGCRSQVDIRQRTDPCVCFCSVPLGAAVLPALILFWGGVCVRSATQLAPLPQDIIQRCRKQDINCKSCIAEHWEYWLSAAFSP